MYDNIPNGWTAVCWWVEFPFTLSMLTARFCFAFCAACTPFPFFTAGNRTLWERLRKTERAVVEGSAVLGAASIHRS